MEGKEDRNAISCKRSAITLINCDPARFSLFLLARFFSLIAYDSKGKNSPLVERRDLFSSNSKMAKNNMKNILNRNIMKTMEDPSGQIKKISWRSNLDAFTLLNFIAWYPAILMHLYSFHNVQFVGLGPAPRKWSLHVLPRFLQRSMVKFPHTWVI